ncbi:efflux RND transporter periplasmic adaptor subunit [Hymenobacter aerilatus]|uniref:Efflux RND transporter periplasmic adaptor subunit n=1 Tax=Hymenobacter aerilatus TaxID=2932251 RepID=A0A8T9SWA0_9BACT|nr:efflux RND transporter periplasmic adaptor subunit [Hymenobacter aerilatus]UOR04066.1 efflux RND transporter periplasmic adaptor subunit [Hymenobacter aerilatus]
MTWNSKRVWPVFVSSALLLASCGSKDEAAQQQQGPPPAVPVAVYKVQSEDVVSTDTYPGTVVPLNEVQLLAEVTGFLTNIYVQDGQHVTKGQKLYTIDRTRYAAAANEAQAQLDVAKTNYDRAVQDAQRYERLDQLDAVAKQQVDIAKAGRANAASQVEAARANLRSVNLDLLHATITAPLTGTIGIAQVKLGALVTQGQTLINTVSAEDPIAVDVNIGEADITRFLELQRNSSAAQDSVFTLMLPGNQEYPLPGKIVTVDRAVDPQTGTLRVRIQFPNPKKLLKAGLNVSVRVRNQDNGNQLVIPTKALTEQLGEFYVYVVGDSNKVAQQKVATGAKIQGKTVVRQGLKEGQTIVSDGVQNLRQGAVVQVGDPSKPAAAQGQGQPAASGK